MKTQHVDLTSGPRAQHHRRAAQREAGETTHLVGEDGSKAIGVCCCSKMFVDADSAADHEVKHQDQQERQRESERQDRLYRQARRDYDRA